MYYTIYMFFCLAIGNISPTLHVLSPTKIVLERNDFFLSLAGLVRLNASTALFT